MQRRYVALCGKTTVGSSTMREWSDNWLCGALTGLWSRLELTRA